LTQKCKVVRAMQERVAVCGDTQTEHVLNRQSLGVGRVNHILRVHGHELAREGGALEAFDELTRDAMDRLFPGLTPDGHDQASLAAAKGGLGWRKASDVARPANLGALVMATPKVQAMAQAAVRAGLLREGQIEQLLAARTQMVEGAYMNELHENERERAATFLRKAKEAAEKEWRATLEGRGRTVGRAPIAEATYAGADEHAVVDEDAEADGGSADLENASRRLTAAHLQKELARLQDCTRLRELEVRLRAQCEWEQLERLKDLRHPEMSHAWLWHLDATKGSVLSEVDYIIGIQKRLGARIYSEPLQCRLCERPVDTKLEHSELCSTAEATRGHYACVRALVDGLRLADPGVTTEPRGLTDSMARPADILTNAAVPGRGAALDICIASPSASAAAGDAAAAAFRRKLRKYRHVIPQLARAGITFRPMVWTSEGRPHPAVTRTLRFAAGVAARRAGSEATALLSRWKHEVQIAIQRRRAAMARAVLPRATPEELWLLTGQGGLRPDPGDRAPPLDEEDVAE
jgi:hypothetical protein